ncbi:hypothetical protein ACFL2M_01375 [Patescibacteria group bacterium]
MPAGLTQKEKKLADHAKKAIVKYNKMRHRKGGIDTLYAFVMTDSGEIHDGACLESGIGSARVCGERHAIANMVMGESYAAKIKSIIVVDPVPEEQPHSTTPCGTCRHIIWELGTPDTSVLCLQYIHEKDKYTFPKIEKHTIKKLYPSAFVPVEWD